MKAAYIATDRVRLTLNAGETVGTAQGPGTFDITPREGLVVWDALVKAKQAPSAPVWGPDNPTLSDWRVGVTLWGRMDDITARIATLAASTDPKQAMAGKIAKERIEYANSVVRAQLIALKDALGFSEPEIDESLWRADRVRQGDVTGVWPLPSA